MNLRITIVLVLLCLIGYSCKQTNTQSSKAPSVEEEYPETNHPEFVSKMEVAHHKRSLLNHGIVCFNLDMTFGTRNTKMKLFTTPNSSAIRLDKKDGASTVVLDGQMYTDADSSGWRSEKFGVFTYQYFFMAPYKFSDEGTVWEKMTDIEIDGKKMNRAKLTFESGTGDAPDDWYIVHSDPDSHIIKLIGYIVTGGGTSVEEAEQNAHAVRYSDYKDIDGIPFATKWEFYDYNQTLGLGKKIGEGLIKNIELMDVVDQFDIIEDGTYQKM